MNRFIGTIVLICFVLLGGWLLGCGTTPRQESVLDSERKAVTDDADQLKKAPRKRAKLLMYA